MRKFLILSAFSFGLCLFILTGMTAFRRIQPVGKELRQAGFDVCDGVPCFMGIVPQQTSLQATLQNLSPYLKPTVLISQDLSDGVFDVSYATGRFGALSDGFGATDYVEMGNFQASFPTLGNFLLLYGQPCYIRIWEFRPGTVRTTLFYPGLVLTVVGASAQHLSPQQPIETLSLIRVANVCYDPLSRVEHSDWRGFTAVNMYR